MLIGLSVSGCIGDMARGEIDIDQVAYIIGGINPTYNGDSVEYGLDNISKHYNATYWKDLPNAEAIFREWFSQGRILCSRMQVEDDFDTRILLIADGRWLACEQVNRVEEYFGEPEWM